MQARRFLAYAKVNLCLAIVGRRPDGYHEIDTVMQTVDLADRLTFVPLEEPSIELICPAGGAPDGPQNLAHRALELLRRRHGCAGGLRVTLEKRIPAGAGLGGGSADAACTLAAANRIWDLGLAEDELEALGAELGSDVPFFIRGGTQRCGGRGERLERWAPPEVDEWVIVKPRWNLATAAVYARLCSGLTPAGAPPTIPSDPPAKRDLPALGDAGRNDLEAPALVLEPAAARLAERLRAAGLLGVRQSGSGSAWFGRPRDRDAARQVETLGREEGWLVFRVQPTTRGWIEEKP